MCGAYCLRSRVIFLLARLIPSLAGVVTTAILTRILDPATYGFYALGLTLIAFLTLGAFEWLGLSVLRMARTAEDPDLFFGTVMTCFVATFLLCAAAGGLIVELGGLREYRSLALAGLLAAFVSAWLELKQRLQLAELRETDYFRTSVGRGFLAATFVCVTAYFDKNAAAILLALAIGVFAAGVVVREPRITLFRLRFDSPTFGALFRFGIPLAISIAMGTFLMAIDKWMLQILVGPKEVGLFTAATLVAQTPIFSLAAGIGPWAYSMAVQSVEFRSTEATNAQLARNFSILLGIILPGAAGITALSSNLAHLLVGDVYRQSVELLAPWLSAGAIMASMRSFYVDIAFQLGHRTLPLTWISALAIGINIAMDYWLIPPMGQLGAAISSFCALTVSLAVAAIASRPVYRLPLPVADLLKITVSAAAMFGALRLVGGYTGTFALACQIAGGFVIYSGGIVLFNTMGVRERLRLRYFRWLASYR
jgi:O-antigen/teichoic acid export membrane protein